MFRTSSKRVVVVLVVLVYTWIYVLDTGGEIGPEELSRMKAELNDWVHDNEEDLRSLQKDRRKSVEETCKRYGLGRKADPTGLGKLGLDGEGVSYYISRVNWPYMYWDKAHSLVWCKVPKAGSSTWAYNMLKLAGAQGYNKTRMHKLLRDAFPKVENNKMMHDNFRFMFVRHPFERILSAYRDKLEDYNRDLVHRDGFYYASYGKNIVADYREHRERKLKNITGQKEPTWREFVSYLLDTPVNKYDEHWAPIWMLCSPCIVKYDVIGKMESFNEDTQYAIQAAGLEHLLAVEWKHRTGTGSDMEMIASYYEQLTEIEVAALFKKYQLDFELYQYDPEPFFQLTRKEQP